MSSTQQLLLGEGAGGAAPVYIEDVFSTYLYTGNGSTQTITNNIDLSTKGGMVWIKSRSNATSNTVFDTVRGATKFVCTDTTNSQDTINDTLTSFNTTGFTLGSDALDGKVNTSPRTYVSWTFREQPKFFDVLTFTGTGSAQTINHNLGSTPGCIIIKRTDDTSNWVTWHRALPDPVDGVIFLNTTGTESIQGWFNSINSTSFSITGSSSVNANGGSYVVYLFAHNAGGFGAAGTDNVISCGSYTGTGSTLTVTLGYEVQWLLVKRANGSTANWILMDVMRGLSYDNAAQLSPNTSGAENNAGVQCNPIATGFQITSTGSNLNNSGNTYIYIAIRRGPMKVPTSATTVFNPDYAWNTNTNILGYLGQPTDAFWLGYLSGDAVSVNTRTRLVGGNRLTTSSTAAEVVDATTTYWDNQLGFATGGSLTTSLITWNFRRAPSFFDVVICTQTGSAQNVTHNLGVAPELLILKDRTSAVSWQVGTQFTSTTWNNLVLNNTDAGSVGAYNNYINAQPTSTVFRLGSSLGSVNDSFVAYLFATCAGVSKVGSYTGTGALQTINCGFTSGARFVFIKRTDSTGGWFTYDSVRGITGSDDPYLRLNSSAAQVTNTNYVDTDSTGFKVTAAAPAELNASGGTYIFLAIA